jgi:hypothetical protein
MPFRSWSSVVHVDCYFGCGSTVFESCDSRLLGNGGGGSTSVRTGIELIYQIRIFNLADRLTFFLGNHLSQHHGHATLLSIG